MATINLPFAASGPRRIPTSGELATGYQCGPLDEKLDNWLEWWTTAQIASAIAKSGLTIDDTDIQRLAKAIRSQSMNYVATVGGTANALTVTLDPAPAAYTEINATPFLLKPASNNTGAATINFNGLGALPILTRKGAAIQQGDLLANTLQPVIVTTTAVYLGGLAYSEFRQRVSALTIYVRTDGNDNNDGLTNTAGGACLTILGAIARSRSYDVPGGSITIQLGSGVFGAPGNITSRNDLILRGDPTTPSNVVIAGTPANSGLAQVSAVGCSVQLTGATVRIDAASGYDGVGAVGGGNLTLTNVVHASSVANTSAFVAAGQGGTVTIGSGCVVSGNAGAYLVATGGAIGIAANIAVPSAVTFNVATARAINLGQIVVQGSFNFTGAGVAGTVGTRYGAVAVGLINVNGGGANYFPGNAAGVSANGGVYVP